MGDRTPFVVGILAIVAVVAWLVLRGDGAQPTAKPEAPPVARGSARVNAPERPALDTTRPELPALPASGPTAEDTFSEQDRDPVWAPKTEAEITKRWKTVRGAKLDATECRRTQCRLVIAGTEQEVAASIADLEGPRGLHGFAENVLLTNPTKTGDTITLRIYATFDR